MIAHLGAPDHDALVALAEEHPGVWLDRAMVFTDPAYLGPAPLHLVERLARLGDRVVFGSDFPTIPQAYAAQVSELAGLGLGGAWLRKVLWHNGLRLFGLRTSAPPAAPTLRSRRSDSRRSAVAMISVLTSATPSSTAIRPRMRLFM